MNDCDLSVVIPVSRRANDLANVLGEVRGAVEKAGKSYEVVLVVDGEIPQRLEEARRLAAHDERIRVLHFARRFGEGAALRAGLEATRAPLLMTYPAYFQVDSAVIGRLLETVDDGADMAFASRLPRSDSLFNRLQRWGFNALVRRFLGVRHRDVACGVRVLRRQALEDIAVHGAFHRFITLAAIMSGFVSVEVDAPLHAKGKGMRPYGPLTYVRRVLDILNVFFLTKFMHKPLRFFGLVGALLLVPGVLLCLWLSGMKIFAGIALGTRPLFLFGVILTVLGFQILAIGLLGEIISFSQAARNKAYAIREVVRKQPARKRREKVEKA